ncbi:ABC transporter permease subunit [Peribacillus sp. SCS-155]|uniref:ABC transporter permease n=1 Tax=Peribacillus sedimenti TaxID=3115297 RepID=UPI0039066085
MLNLIRNELMKIFKRPGTYVMIGMLLMIVGIAGGVIKYQESKQDAKQENWQQTVKAEIKEYNEQLKAVDGAPAYVKQELMKEIELREYRLENDIPPNDDYNLWGFVDDASDMIQFAGLFTIIIAAGIVSSEFKWGTIKLVLIRPISRGKILLAKYSAVIIVALLFLAIVFVFSALVGVILFGTPEKAVPYLNYFNGKITEQSMAFHLILFYAMKSVSMVMLATMAFMISAVFRNSSLAIGLMIFLMFTGTQLTGMLATKFAWAKYILFANIDLVQYFEGTPMVEGMTLPFSIIMLLIYFAVFQFFAYYIFKKRDVAA